MTPEIVHHVIPHYHKFQCTERMGVLETDIIYGSYYDFFDTTADIMEMWSIGQKYNLMMLIDKCRCMIRYKELCSIIQRQDTDQSLCDLINP